MKPLSLYIHIPFCVRKCFYCDFLSGSAAEEDKDSYIDALITELYGWKSVIRSSYDVKTVFIGGGTPTCLSDKQLGRVCDAVNDAVDGTVVEFTTESNPGTITKEHVRMMRDAGINRVSLGLQSAQNNELKSLGRIHTYEDFLYSYHLLRDAGVDNINVDLMSDIPGQTMASYSDTLKKVLQLHPEHISSYSLIIEPGTKFYDMYQKGELHIANEDIDRDMYQYTQDILAAEGYNRYEISNYSQPDMECKHNITYWTGGDYLGVGLGASSYMAGMRFTNTRDMNRYLQQFAVKSLPDMPDNIREHIYNMASSRYDFEKLTTNQQMEEFMFLGLRMCEGVLVSKFNEDFGVSIHKVYGDVIARLVQNKLLAEDENSGRIYLTNRGIDISNYVLSEFLLD